MASEMEFPVRPVQMSGRKTTDSVAQSLPALTRYKGVPKRYEETRPVLIQGYAHNRILGIGQELHKKTLELADTERMKAMREAEKVVWSQAEQLQAEAVQRAREEAAIEQERILKKITKAQEKALKEEALRVEMAMQKLAIEQVKQARAHGEAKLKEAVRVTEEKWRADLKAAVEKARQEEQSLAANEAARVAAINKIKYDDMVKKLAQEKVKAIADLEAKKDAERVKAVSEAEDRERKIAVQKVENLTREYEKKLEQLRLQIKEREVEITKRERIIEEINLEKENVENAIVKIQVTFQDFIDRIRCFEEYKGQADYLLQSVYIDEISKYIPNKLLKVKTK